MALNIGLQSLLVLGNEPSGEGIRVRKLGAEVAAIRAGNRQQEGDALRML